MNVKAAVRNVSIIQMIKLWHVQMKQDISNDTVYKVDVYH